MLTRTKKTFALPRVGRRQAEVEVEDQAEVAYMLVSKYPGQWIGRANRF